ncbi:hypothetical protein NGAV_gp03 [Hapavirus ngaingan]|uniref:Uncharacterized protein U1/U2 n=1 Tax=Hapavirus ngaingan TaxID=1972623 RepID=D3GGL3_9RHAB|nr:hypothetical protein NGAV_gp03 [Hapavirus ngaingan]ACX83604.1 unknown [Hapavirus ngaingan]
MSTKICSPGILSLNHFPHGNFCKVTICSLGDRQVPLKRVALEVYKSDLSPSDKIKYIYHLYAFCKPHVNEIKPKIHYTVKVTRYPDASPTHYEQIQVGDPNLLIELSIHTDLPNLYADGLHLTLNDVFLMFHT